MLIYQAYNYLDKQKNKYEKYNIESSDINFIVTAPEVAADTNPYMFNIYEKVSKRSILKGTCSVIGVFNNTLSTWQWGWSIPFKFKTQNYISRKILNYAFDIDISVPGSKEENIQQNMILKTELLHSNIYMESPSIEIEKYLAIALYLVQGEYYYKETRKNINIKTNESETIGEIYYILKDIVEA